MKGSNSFGFSATETTIAKISLDSDELKISETLSLKSDKVLLIGL